MSQTAAEKAALYRRVTEQDDVLRGQTRLHSERWPTRTPRVALERPAPPLVPPPSSPERQPLSVFAQPMLDKIPSWRVGERRVARAIAGDLVEQDYQAALGRHERDIAEQELRLAERARRVEYLSAEQEAENRLLKLAFERLTDGERRACERAIRRALPTIPVPCEMVGWHRGAGVIRLSAPDVSVIPERRPSMTPAGKPTTKKRAQGEQNDALAELVASLTLAAGRLAFAAAPGIELALVVACSADGMAVAQCLLDRNDKTVAADAVEALLATGGLISQSGRTRTLDAIDLDDPELEQLLHI